MRTPTRPRIKTGDYSRATALEALCGYLYLAGRMERLEELLNIILQEEEENHG